MKNTKMVKIVQQSGNAGHVYLPKQTIGKKVMVTVVEKGMEEIRKEALEILMPYLEHIQGVYLHGSYARGDQTPESDIDLLIITDGKVKISKRIMEYEIIAVGLEDLQKSIDYTAPLILPIIFEAKPILNNALLESYKKTNLTKQNTKWYMETTESSLELANLLIDMQGGIPQIIYPLVLRLRGLLMVRNIINRSKYSNKQLLEYLCRNQISRKKAEEIYTIYQEQRDDKRISPNTIDYQDAKKVYELVLDEYRRVKRIWERLD